ncbi:hypothetical protein C8T65DRAFT_121760 [Cerioporus squamosus]|nr:hypothetical protein C8T65DRAFT_121760 [Cerioporus squamosus]
MAKQRHVTPVAAGIHLTSVVIQAFFQSYLKHDQTSLRMALIGQAGKTEFDGPKYAPCGSSRRLLLYCDPHARLPSADRVDYSTLCSCTLVCRAWLPRSRCNMTFRVILYTPSQLESFLSVESHYPVRELELGPLDMPTRYRPDSEVDIMGPSIGLS